MGQIPLFVIAGQSNAVFGGIDNRLYELATAQGTDFQIIRSALGGTSLYPTNVQFDWDPASGELFTELVNKVAAASEAIRAAGHEPVVHTFWVQGEQDRDQTTYGDKLTDFITQYREAIGQPESRFTIALLPYASAARDGQLAAAASLANVLTVDPVGAKTWDGTHYDKPTREGLAEKFFAATEASFGSDLGFDHKLETRSIRVLEDGVYVIGPRYSDFTYTNTSAPITIRTVNGDDVITTGKFNDVISTHDNNDKVYSGGGADVIDLGSHDDLAEAGAGNDVVRGGNGDDRILGEDGADRLFGDGQADLLRGGTGDDTLDGGQGNDRLIGDEGNDRLLGGAGADILRGGSGADRFIFTAGDFSADLRASRDMITDFSAAEGDVINLFGIDANVNLEGNNRFTFIGAERFSKAAGELRVVQTATATSILGDVNGDGVADFWINLRVGTMVPVESIVL